MTQPASKRLLTEATGRKFSNAMATANTALAMSKLRRGIEDVSIVFVSDSLMWGNVNASYLTGVGLASRFPAYTVIWHPWDQSASAGADATYDGATGGSAVTIQTGTGSKTLHLWNFARSGKYIDGALGSRYATAIAAKNPDLVFINHGKNGGTATSNRFEELTRGQFLALTERVRRDFPSAGVVLLSQIRNAANDYMRIMAKIVQELAADKGYGFIDLHQLFEDTGSAASYLKVDGLHPTTAGDTAGPSGKSGAQMMADGILAAMTTPEALTSGLVVHQQSSLITPGKIIAGGDFTGYTTGAPAPWGLDGATATKDTRAGYWSSPNGYSVRVQATGAAASSLWLNVANYTAFAGQWVTLCAKLRVDAGTATTGTINLSDGVSTGIPAGSTDAFGALREVVVPFKVAASPTMLQARIYADYGNNAAADISVDYAYIVRGRLPALGVA